MTTAAAPSLRPEALPAVTRAGLVERRAQAGERVGGDALLDELVGVELRRALLGDDVDRDDLVLELAGLLRGLGLLLRGGGELVLLAARDVVLLGDVLGRRAHVVLVVDVPEAVGDHGVDQLPVAHAHAVARVGQHVAAHAHAFLAAGDDDLGVAALDRLRREVGRLQARAAHLADDEGRHAVGQSRLDDGLARRVLAGAGGEHLAEDHLVDALGGDARALQQRLDDGGAQVRGGNLGERPAELADCRARGSDDDHIFHRNAPKRDWDRRRRCRRRLAAPPARYRRRPGGRHGGGQTAFSFT